MRGALPYGRTMVMSVQFATCILEPGVLYACILKQNSRYLRGVAELSQPQCQQLCPGFLQGFLPLFRWIAVGYNAGPDLTPHGRWRQ